MRVRQVLLQMSAAEPAYIHTVDDEAPMATSGIFRSAGAQFFECAH
jgi:hypothetical protein